MHFDQAGGDTIDNECSSEIQRKVEVPKYSYILLLFIARSALTAVSSNVICFSFRYARLPPRSPRKDLEFRILAATLCLRDYNRERRAVLLVAIISVRISRRRSGMMNAGSCVPPRTKLSNALIREVRIFV